MLLPLGGSVDGIYDSGLPPSQQLSISAQRKSKLYAAIAHDKEALRLMDESEELFVRIARRIDYALFKSKK